MGLYGNYIQEAYNVYSEDLDINLQDNKYIDFSTAMINIARKIRKLYPQVLNIFKADRELSKMIYNEYYKDYEVYPMDTIRISSGNVHGIHYEIDDNHNFKYFCGSIYFMGFETYLIKILNKYVDSKWGKLPDENEYNISNYKKFEAFFENKFNVLKSKIETLAPEFIEIYAQYPDEAQVKQGLKNKDDIDSISIDFKIKDEYTSKLLGINSSESDRFAKVVAKIKDTDKENIVKIYNSVTNWIRNPKQITGKMDYIFDDIYWACKNNIVDTNLQQLVNIIVKNKSKFNTVPPKEFLSDDIDEEYVKSKLGTEIRLIEDYNSGSGDYVVLARGKLFYINLEHNEIEDINQLPFGSVFDGYHYDIKIIKYIIENYKK